MGIALWNLKPWARKGTMVLWTIQAILALFSLGDNIVTLILAIIVIVYLSGKDIKQAFQENRCANARSIVDGVSFDVKDYS